jgi:putative ABC transport system substrate-binding protein
MTLGFGRRAFMALLVGAAAAQPLPLRAQQPGRIRRVGVLMGLAEDAESRLRLKAFEQAFEKEGWALGQNLRIDYRFAAGHPERMRAYARELVGLRPDVIVGHSTPVVAELVQATRTIPIVFVVVGDPVGSGFVSSIPRPGGNATGFISVAASIPGKLLTILKQLTPNLARVALMFNAGAVPPTRFSSVYLHPFESAAFSSGIETIAAPVDVPADIERSMTELARTPNVGIIVMPDNFLTVYRQLIISLSAKLRIPAVYPYRYFAEAGGLMSYGVDVTDLFRRAPEYVSRILRGAKPAELPVQAPTKFELVINLRTARALGLDVPRVLLVAADDLIE